MIEILYYFIKSTASLIFLLVALYVAFAFQRCDDTLGPAPSVPESSSLKRKHEEEVSAADKPSVKECA